jgi:imidazolonepropionase-like amidohydrolase
MSTSPHGPRPEHHDEATLVVTGAQVMDRDGTFSPATVTVVGGTIVAVERGGTGVVGGPSRGAGHGDERVPGTLRHDVHSGGATLDDVQSDGARLGIGRGASDGGPPQDAAAGRRPGTVRRLDASGRWLIPGVVDCHTHLGWTTFLPEDEDDDRDEDGAGATAADHRMASAADRADAALLSRAAPGLAATLRAGVTSVRDAGGAASAIRDALVAGRLVGPQMHTAVATITDELARDPAALRARVRSLVAEGADWIKVVATGGVMAPDGSEDESPFDERDLRAVVDEAAGLGVRVMVHAWGGDALTHSIAAGVASVEHGMFLTERQADAGAARGVVLVPTLAIYSEVAEMARRGELPERVRARASRVVEAHPRAVRRAVEAGMTVAMGSDFGTTDQHGRNLTEIDHLAAAGLGAAGALVAATQAGARLLGSGTGVLEPGQVFDAVLLTSDPTDTAVLRDPRTVETVFLGGAAVG